MGNELATAVEAALHEWNTMPQWKRQEIEKETRAAYVLANVRTLVLEENRCWYCNGSGIMAGPMEYCIYECSTCSGTGRVKVYPTMEQVKELIK